MARSDNITIRECASLEELAACVRLQREVFALPEIEISPVRHFVVTKNAGGFTLGAFDGDQLIGFVLSVPAYLRGERAFYSHMTAVRSEYQSLGIGQRLKWAQRERSLAEGVRFIKWTFEPVKVRNAFFNLEKLGAVVREYQENFYGIDYSMSPEESEPVGLASDRLFAEWELESEKVVQLSNGKTFQEARSAVQEIVIPIDWYRLIKTDAKTALAEQMRTRAEFESGFSKEYVCRSFARDDVRPRFLLYKD